jgi:hypothetical protein
MSCTLSILRGNGGCHKGEMALKDGFDERDNEAQEKEKKKLCDKKFPFFDSFSHE